MIRVAVIDSHPVFLTGLVTALSKAGITVLSAKTSPHPQPSWAADAFLVDPEVVEPVASTDYISRLAAVGAVLVLSPSTYHESQRYLQAGAAAVVSKREPADVVVKAVRSIVGKPVMVHAGTRAADRADSEVAEPQPLSTREAQVLHYIACGFTHSQVADRLHISRHTVDTYVKRIRTKHGLGNKAELTRAALAGRLAGSLSP